MKNKINKVLLELSHKNEEDIFVLEQKFSKKENKFSPLDLAFLIRSGNEHTKVMASNLFLKNNFQEKMSLEEKMDVLRHTGSLYLASNIFSNINMLENGEEFKDACFCVLKNDNLSISEKETLLGSKKIKNEINNKDFFSKREKELLNISSDSFLEVYL